MLARSKLVAGYVRFQHPSSPMSSVMSVDVSGSSAPVESRVCRDIMVEKFNRVNIIVIYWSSPALRHEPMLHYLLHYYQTMLADTVKVVISVRSAVLPVHGSIALHRTLVWLLQQRIAAVTQTMGLSFYGSLWLPRVSVCACCGACALFYGKQMLWRNKLTAFRRCLRVVVAPIRVGWKKFNELSCAINNQLYTHCIRLLKLTLTHESYYSTSVQ